MASGWLESLRKTAVPTKFIEVLPPSPGVARADGVTSARNVQSVKDTEAGAAQSAVTVASTVRRRRVYNVCIWMD